MLTQEGRTQEGRNLARDLDILGNVAHAFHFAPHASDSSRRETRERDGGLVRREVPRRPGNRRRLRRKRAAGFAARLDCFDGRRDAQIHGATELGFVLLHYHQLHPLDPRPVVVTDFAPAKDIAFARMNLQGESLRLFDHVYERLSGRLQQPTVAVFLELDIDDLLKRIRNRGKSYELRITKEYLLRLREAYAAIFDQLSVNVRLVRVSSTDSREAVANNVLAAIRETGVIKTTG